MAKKANREAHNDHAALVRGGSIGEGRRDGRRARDRANLFVWNGLMAPVGTPSAIIAALNREALICQQKPEVKTRMEAGAYEQGMLDPAEFAALVDKDLRTWGNVVRETGVRISS